MMAPPQVGLDFAAEPARMPLPMRPLSRLLACLIATSLLPAQPAPRGTELLKTREAKANAANWPDHSKGSPTPHAPAELPPAATSSRPQSVAPPAPGERVVFLGNGFAERDTYYGRLETELHLRFPAQTLFVRNLGRSGDTPAFRPHPARPSQWAFPGAEKFHPEFAQHNGKGFFPTPDQWLFHLKADTIVAFFGYNESFDGAGRVANYEAEVDAFVVHSLSKAYNGKTAPRLVLVSPIAFEDLSAKRDLPNGKAENAHLELYAAAMERVAKKHGLTYVDLFHPSLAAYRKAVALDPDYGEAHYALSFTLAISDLAAGKVHFDRAMALGVPDTRDLRGQFYGAR
jgi:hypothetical protein